jgi:hypothetical protein
MQPTKTAIALRRSSKSERTSVESIFNYDDTLPLPDEVAQEFSDKAGDGLTALAWLAEHGIDPTAISESVALIQYGMVWNHETGRYQFVIYEPDHIGPKHPPELAIPIIEDGKLLDLLVISDEMSFDRITCRAPWLGRANLTLPVVRLHPHPMDWLEAGCTGVCHIEATSRKALKDLSRAATIECNDIHTALEAWSWGFSDDDDELARFVIDDSPFSIRSYFEDEARRRTAYLARDLS